jgi:hypothetical protein
MDMAELLEDVQARGYTSNFALSGERLRCSESNAEIDASDAWIEGSQSVDGGTDPGDDATIYLINTRSGQRGYLMISDSFHADPVKAAFIDRLPRADV